MLQNVKQKQRVLFIKIKVRIFWKIQNIEILFVHFLEYSNKFNLYQ